MYTSINFFLREIVERERKNRFIICPFGRVGKMVKDILGEKYGIRELLALDDLIVEDGVFPLSYLDSIDIPSDCYVILATVNDNIYKDKMKTILRYFDPSHIIPVYPIFDNLNAYLERCGFDFNNTILQISDKTLFYLPYWNQDYIQKTIASSGRYYEDVYLDWVISVFKERIRGKVFLDVGANVGNHSIFFAKYGGASRICAFEPIPHTFDILKKNIELNNLGEVILPVNKGIGEKNGKARINAYCLDNIGGTSICEDENGVIEVNCLDEMRFEENIGLIKIDVEGFEKRVIKGAIETIKKNLPVIMLESYESDVLDYIYELLSSLGYRVRNYDTVNYVFYIGQI